MVKVSGKSRVSTTKEQDKENQDSEISSFKGQTKRLGNSQLSLTNGRPNSDQIQAFNNIMVTTRGAGSGKGTPTIAGQNHGPAGVGKMSKSKEARGSDKKQGSPAKKTPSKDYQKLTKEENLKFIVYSNFFIKYKRLFQILKQPLLLMVSYLFHLERNSSHNLTSLF